MERTGAEEEMKGENGDGERRKEGRGRIGKEIGKRDGRVEKGRKGVDAEIRE